MASGYIDANGFHMPTYDDILEDLKIQVRNIYGQGLYLEPDSKDGQWLAVFARAAFDTYACALSVYNSFSPSTAQGAGLDRMVKLNGLARATATYSRADVVITGAVGTVIHNGIAEDELGQRWNLPATVAIPTSGTVITTVTAQETGKINAAAGTIKKIVTPVRGWTAITNPKAAKEGIPVETDAELRIRQSESTGNSAMTILEGLQGALKALEGVSRVKIYDNDENTEDANGIPAHSIGVVAEGGDQQAIIDVIGAKKTPGTGTAGNTSGTYVDRVGNPKTIHFYRPAEVRIHLKMLLEPLKGYVKSTEDIIRNNLMSHINNMDIGSTIYLNRVRALVSASEPIPGQITYDISSLEMSADGITYEAANIILEYNGIAVTAADIIDIEVLT